MQLKVGGRLHLKLNIGERPIANKYREGKMKSTLERELKVREIVEREALGVSHAARDSALRCTSRVASQHWFVPLEKGAGNVALRCVIAPCWIQRCGSRNAARPMAGLRTPSCLGC